MKLRTSDWCRKKVNRIQKVRLSAARCSILSCSNIRFFPSLSFCFLLISFLSFRLCLQWLLLRLEIIRLHFSSLSNLLGILQHQHRLRTLLRWKNQKSQSLESHLFNPHRFRWDLEIVFVSVALPPTLIFLFLFPLIGSASHTVALQIISMALIANIFNNDERFYSGSKLSSGFFLQISSWTFSALIVGTLIGTGYHAEKVELHGALGGDGYRGLEWEGFFSVCELRSFLFLYLY